MKWFFRCFSVFLLLGIIQTAYGGDGSGLSGQNSDLENHIPTALLQNLTTSMGGEIDITLTGSDVDGDSLIFTIESSPLHGTLFGTEQNITYIPNNNYSGADSFSFTANDGKATSTAATVTISIPISPGNVESTDLGFATLTAIDVPLPDLMVNAKEVYQLTHYIGRTNGEGSADDIDIPIRSYSATCNNETETPSMFVSVTVSDGTNASDTTYGSVYELQYNPDTLSFEETGNTTILNQCYESHGITASADCSRVAVLCNTGYKASEEYPVDADIVEQYGSNWMKNSEDNLAFQVDPADYKYNDQIWLLEWDNKELSEVPAAYVVNKMHGGTHLAAQELIYVEDDSKGLDSYGFSVTTRVFNDAGSHYSAALTIIERDDWSMNLYDPGDDTSRGWSWYCGQGHVLNIRGYYNSFIEEYGAICTSDGNHWLNGDHTNPNDSINLILSEVAIKKGKATTSAYNQGKINHFVPSSNAMISNGGGHTVVPLSETENISVIVAPKQIEDDNMAQFIADKKAKNLDDFNSWCSDDLSDTCLCSDVLDMPNCFVSYMTAGSNKYPSVTSTGDMQDLFGGDLLDSTSLTRIGLAKVSASSTSVLGDYTWIVEDDDCQISDPQLVDLHNGRYLLGYARFQCVSDQLSYNRALSDKGSLRMLTPKDFYVMEIDSDFNILEGPVALPNHGWGGLDEPVFMGNGKVAWTYIKNPEIESYGGGQQNIWEAMVYHSNSADQDPDPDPESNAPIALLQNVTTSMGVEIDITLTGSDVDGDSLIFTIESSPLYGTLIGTEPNLTYIPNNNYSGTDSFTFTANDGEATSTAATVTITIPISPGNEITKISTGPLPGGLSNAPERLSLPHLIGSHRTNDVKVPVRSYSAACDVDTDTPRMYVSLSLEDTRPNANEKLPSVGSVMEFIYDKDDNVFKRTGNEAIIDLCNESGGITVSRDCSRIGLVCHTAFEEHVSLTEPFTKDLVADASPTKLDQPDNHSQVDSEDDYEENGELWLLEWNNQQLSDEPDKYVIHKGVGGIHGGPTGLFYAEDDNSYASTTVSSIFSGGGRHKSASLAVIDRTDWTLFPRTDNGERGWEWNCGEGHVLQVQGFYNSYVNKYGAFCTTDMGYGRIVKNGGGLYMKMEDKGDTSKGNGLYNVASSSTFVANGGSSYVVPVDADKSLALITAPLYPSEEKMYSSLRWGIIDDAVDDGQVVINDDGTFADPYGNTLTLDDICYNSEGMDCLQLYFQNGRYSFRDNFWSGELQTDELTKVGILQVTSSDGSREFDRADEPYENIRWIAEDSDCQLADPQLVDLQNGRYLFGYAKFQCISDGENLERHGGAGTLIPKEYYILEIDADGNKLTEPVPIPGTGWGGLDRIISIGEGKAAWAYIPDPEINDDGTYSDPRRTEWEIMVYTSPLGV